jgi:hypothetical protein
MKKQSTMVKKLKINRETLLPLASRQIYSVKAGAGAGTAVHLNNSRVIHD